MLIGSHMKHLASKTYTAHTSAGADPDSARDAAEEVGELGAAIARLDTKTNILIGLVLAVLAALFQIALRLD
jgi:methylmalonyl-CoA mutase N-terminal domain/subunit